MLTLDQIIKLLQALKKGKEIPNAAAWKAGIVNVGLIAGVLTTFLGTLRAFGIDINISDEQIGRISLVLVPVISIVVSVLTAATSTRAGLPGTTAVEPELSGVGEKSTSITEPTIDRPLVQSGDKEPLPKVKDTTVGRPIDKESEPYYKSDHFNEPGA